MKLTSEGAARLGRHESRGFPVGDFEFQPEDFDGCCQNGKDHLVGLTVKEAKVIEELALLCLFLRPKAVTIEKAKVMKELNNRIKQAEKCDE